MEASSAIAVVAAALIGAQWAASLWLSRLNRSHVLARTAGPPAALAGFVDEPTYRRSVDYTLAKTRFNQVAETYGAVVFAAVLFSGILPWAYESTLTSIGSSSWAMALFLFLTGLAVSAVHLPLRWVAQFRLEERFGFNTNTPRTWWLDVAKAVLLSAAIGYPMLVLVLEIVEWAGTSWWLWTWGALIAFQAAITVLAPVLILPLFNKLTPLPAGSLRDRLTDIAGQTDFTMKSIQVMDGSRRSRHSNAFFTGFGRLRKIVLFDTLIDQMGEAEIAAVLAHEIGHSKRKHVPKMLLAFAAGTGAGLALVAWIATRPAFTEAFGFQDPASATPLTATGVAPVIVVIALLAGTITFWLSPAVNWMSRRYEYEADAFAKATIGDATPMIDGLRKLSKENLTNLTPHPTYSRFHYSHPTLVEREAALKQA